MTFNQELINKARKGEIAILNDGSVEELRLIIDHAAPDCTTPIGESTYYFISRSGGWCQSNFNGNDLPAHSVKDFFMLDTKDQNKEFPKAEYSYWKKAQEVFMNGIDKNKTIPDYAKDDLKQLIKKQFQFLGHVIGTYEVLYLREKQNPPK